jgi:hypothetical protein
MTKVSQIFGQKMFAGHSQHLGTSDRSVKTFPGTRFSLPTLAGCRMLKRNMTGSCPLFQDLSPGIYLRGAAANLDQDKYRSKFNKGTFSLYSN